MDYFDSNPDTVGTNRRSSGSSGYIIFTNILKDQILG
jgi:hypothetical protein